MTKQELIKMVTDDLTVSGSLKLNLNEDEISRIIDVEKNMVDTVGIVEKHIGDQLYRIEIVGFEIVQPQPVVQVYAGDFGQGQCRQPHDEVDDNQIERDRRYRSEKRSVLHINTFFLSVG